MACTNGKCVLCGQVRQLREAGMEALRQGDVEQAETLLRRCVDMSEDGGLDVVTANAAYRLALALHEAGRVDEAAGQFERALELVRQRAGCDSKLYKTILGHFAQALPEQALALAVGG